MQVNVILKFKISCTPYHDVVGLPRREADYVTTNILTFKTRITVSYTLYIYIYIYIYIHTHKHSNNLVQKVFCDQVTDSSVENV